MHEVVPRDVRLGRRAGLWATVHLAVAAAAASAAGCAGASDAPPVAGDLASLQRDLGLGARGADVTAVQRYLEQYGYFPNAELARAYPSWRPLVARPPAVAGVFDENTEAAVRALQKNAALAVTGVVDAATRTLLGQPRCHEPDGLPALDPRNKFALILNVPKWPTTNLTWRFTPPPFSGVPANQARPALAAAFATWASRTNLSFVETSAAADIEINWAGSGPSAGTAPPPNGDITFNYLQAWSTATPTPANTLDFQSVALHEIGHALGIHHSTIAPSASVMNGVPPGQQKRSLGTDDILAVTMLYNPWTLVGGRATDISRGFSDVWAVSDSGFGPGATDFIVQKLAADGSGSVNPDLNMTAVSIATSASGVPWVVKSNGTIFARSNSAAGSGSWTQMPGCARDIGIGGNFPPSVWVIGCGFPDGTVYRWMGSANGWWPCFQGGAAVRIAVDFEGKPWVVNSQGRVFRRTSGDPNSGTWIELPAPSPGAADIGVHLQGETVWTWITNTSGGIFALNQQTGNGNEAGEGFPNRNGWVQVAGGARRVAVYGTSVWVTNSANQIFRLLR